MDAPDFVVSNERDDLLAGLESVKSEYEVLHPNSDSINNIE